MYTPAALYGSTFFLSAAGTAANYIMDWHQYALPDHILKEFRCSKIALEQAVIIFLGHKVGESGRDYLLCHVDVQRYKTHHTGPLYQWRATNKDVGSGSVSGTAICVSLCRVCDYLRGLYKILYQLWPNESNPTISEVKLYQQKKKTYLGMEVHCNQFPQPVLQERLGKML